MNQRNPLSREIIEAATDTSCEKCQNLHFAPVFLIKKVSALISPTGQELNLPVQTFACTKCNHVNEEFLPKPNSSI